MDTEREDECSSGERLGWSLALLFPNMLFTGWVLKTMWGWFLVPMGTVSVSLWQAVGLALTVRLLVGIRASDSKEHPVVIVLNAWLVGLALLGIGALVRLGV